MTPDTIKILEIRFTEIEIGRLRAAMINQIHRYLNEAKQDQKDHPGEIEILRSILNKLGMTFDDKGCFKPL